MSRCVEAMGAIAQAVRGTLAPAEAEALAAHCAECLRCREAHAAAMICAFGLRSAAEGQAVTDAVAWERALFLRLLAEEAPAEGRRPAIWSQLALRLGWTPMQHSKGEWGRWKRDAAVGGSR